MTAYIIGECKRSYIIGRYLMTRDVQQVMTFSLIISRVF